MTEFENAGRSCVNNTRNQKFWTKIRKVSFKFEE